MQMRGFKNQFIFMYDCSHNTVMVLELQARAHYHLLNTVRMTLDGEDVRHKLTHSTFGACVVIRIATFLRALAAKHT